MTKEVSAKSAVVYVTSILSIEITTIAAIVSRCLSCVPIECFLKCSATYRHSLAGATTFLFLAIFSFSSSSRWSWIVPDSTTSIPAAVYNPASSVASKSVTASLGSFFALPPITPGFSAPGYIRVTSWHPPLRLGHVVPFAWDSSRRIACPEA